MSDRVIKVNFPHVSCARSLSVLGFMLTFSFDVLYEVWENSGLKRAWKDYSGFKK
uniref:Uncharacterized protein n=1 Tax=Heterorhabditis bacteriophora TaxID=37862 RepID=A0A1I7WCY6_HETBA